MWCVSGVVNSGDVSVEAPAAMQWCKSMQCYLAMHAMLILHALL